MLGQKIHRYIFLFLTYCLVFLIMFWRAPASFPIILLGANWLIEGDFKRKWLGYKSNRLFWILILPFLTIIAGFTYSADMDWAMNLFRISLPVFVLPLVFFSAKPLSEIELKRSFVFFISACFISTAWSMFYSFVLHPNEALREISRFMSHIRLGLFINMAIAICVYSALKSKVTKHRVAYLLFAFYFIGTLVAMGLATGLVSFGIITLIGFYVVLKKQKQLVKISMFAALIIVAISISAYIFNIWQNQSKVNQGPYNVITKVNARGRPLISFDTLGQKENGNYILINIQLEDLRKAWNNRVPADTFGYESQHNLKRYEVLLRYMTSKSLSKDDDGVVQLSETDIKNIQNNVVNYNYPEWSYLHKRLYELINEIEDFNHRGDVNGHSLTMRFYYWKAALKVIKQNPLMGVGTGDTQTELDKVYKENFPKLKQEWYKRPHNQFLSVTVCFGILGLVLFLLTLFYPIISLNNCLSPLYKIFMVLLLVSFLTEDTLESQAGVGFYAIFNTLFCSVAWFKKQQTPVD